MAFVLWLPSILRNGTQMGMVEAGWLSAVPYLAATIAMVVVSWASDKTQNRKLFVWPLLLVGALAFLGSYLVGSNNFWMSYTLLVIAGAAMYAPYGPFFAIIPEMLPRNVAGGAMALINSMGALGGRLSVHGLSAILMEPPAARPRPTSLWDRPCWFRCG
ncbi:D-galactonate transporter [Pantoea agglomerans]|uniref:D-galactonate transporter n=1 Tax=Enterobacter agglomerans TaxID=549 RepID=A0A379A8S0_ENTAG|nr:D-galactonate transporter [Pantoea agglomerans]